MRKKCTHCGSGDAYFGFNMLYCNNKKCKWYCATKSPTARVKRLKLELEIDELEKQIDPMSFRYGRGFSATYDDLD